MMKMEMMGMTQQANHIFLEVCILQLLIRTRQCVLIFLYLSTDSVLRAVQVMQQRQFLVIGAKSKDVQNKRFTGMSWGIRLGIEE